MTTESYLPASEFDESFIQKMKNRMAVSYHKYGKVVDAFPHKVSALDSLRQRLVKYAADGNTEWLVDAANFCMIEFMHPSHKDAHFKATDSSESPGRIKVDGTVTRKPNDMEV